MRVGERMTRDVVTVQPEQSLDEAARLLKRHRTRYLAVVRKGRLVGMIADRDLMAAWPSPATTLTVGEIRFHLSRIPVKEVMTPEAITIAPWTPLAEAARLMRDWGLGALPVIKGGELVGILTDSDLVALL